jgi:uroporphyrinogen decarboxylase
MGSSILLDLFSGKKVSRSPVWLMRQAGRYLPEYRKIRAQKSGFWDLALDPETAAEITLQPISRFELDAAIIFSDILTPLLALGVEVDFVEKVGPVIKDPVINEQIFNGLKLELDLEGLGFLTQAISMVCRSLPPHIPLIGFAGTPFTVGCYLIEGKSNKTFNCTRKMAYADPVLFDKIMMWLTKATVSYLRLQVNAGAKILMLFDSWAGLIPPCQYMEFSGKYIKQIASHFPDIPLVLFSKDSGANILHQDTLGVDGLGLDWTADLSRVRTVVSPELVLQGNLDPAVLYANDETITAAVEEMYKKDLGKHVFNLGHGLYPDLDPERVGYLIAEVKRISANYGT